MLSGAAVAQDLAAADRMWELGVVSEADYDAVTRPLEQAQDALAKGHVSGDDAFRKLGVPLLSDRPTRR